MVRYHYFPRTEPAPTFLSDVVGVFERHEDEVSTEKLEKGLTSDAVLAILAPGLRDLGFEVEAGKKKSQKIHRPVIKWPQDCARVDKSVEVRAEASRKRGLLTYPENEHERVFLCWDRVPTGSPCCFTATCDTDSVNRYDFACD